MHVFHVSFYANLLGYYYEPFRGKYGTSYPLKCQCSLLLLPQGQDIFAHFFSVSAQIWLINIALNHLNGRFFSFTFSTFRSSLTITSREVNTRFESLE